MVMIESPFRWLYDGETMADHPRPLYWWRCRPDDSLYSSVEWQKFYDPQSQPMGVPKLCVIDEFWRRHMEFERDQYIRGIIRKWALRFLIGGVSIIALVSFFTLLSFLATR